MIPFQMSRQEIVESVPWIQRFPIPRAHHHYNNYNEILRGDLNPVCPPMYIAQVVYHFGTNEQWEHVNQASCGQLSRAVCDYAMLMNHDILYIDVQKSTYAYEDVLNLCLTLGTRSLRCLKCDVYIDFPRTQHNTSIILGLGQSMFEREYVPNLDHDFNIEHPV